MTSYKTLIFGTIAFVCAASPALADSGSAVPGPSRMDSGSAVPKKLDSGSAVPKKLDSGSAVPKKLDSGSAVPRFIVISGVAGLPSMTLDVSWLQHFIGR